jgi:hypothetical protein
MSNELYSFARQQFLSGQLNWLTGTFNVLLVDIGNYTFVKDVDRHLADIPVAARIATSSALTGASATNGVALADDVTINAVTGPSIEAIVIFHDTGNATTSELICYLDTGIGLPWNPQGGNVVIHWDRGPNGIFVL